MSFGLNFHHWMQWKLSLLPLTFRPKGYCRCLCLSVRPFVHPSVHKLYFICTITCHRFEMESSNVHQTNSLECPGLLLKMEVIDLALQGHFGHVDSEFQEIMVVGGIIGHRLGLESPNLYQLCVLGTSAGIENGVNVALVYWSRPIRQCYYTSQRALVATSNAGTDDNFIKMTFRCQCICCSGTCVTPLVNDPDSKVHWTNMGPTWVLSAPAGPHVYPMNVAIRGCNSLVISGDVRAQPLSCAQPQPLQRQ